MSKRPTWRISTRSSTTYQSSPKKTPRKTRRKIPTERLCLTTRGIAGLNVTSSSPTKAILIMKTSIRPARYRRKRLPTFSRPLLQARVTRAIATRILPTANIQSSFRNSRTTSKPRSTSGTTDKIKSKTRTERSTRLRKQWIRTRRISTRIWF